MDPYSLLKLRHSFLNRYSTKIEVLELLKSAKDRLHLTVVAGGLGPAGHSGTIERRARNRDRTRAGRPLSQQRIELRHDKARVFHSKVSCSLLSILRGIIDSYRVLSRGGSFPQKRFRFLPKTLTIIITIVSHFNVW